MKKIILASFVLSALLISCSFNNPFLPTQALFSIINYTINYNLDGGTNNVSNPDNYNNESGTITLKTPTKANYTFGGWYDNEDLTGDNVATIPKGAAGDKTFWAKWTADSFSIAYNLNDGINHASNPVNYTVATATITLLSPARTEYTFGGWYDNEGLSGTAITTIPLGSIGNKTFWAKWGGTVSYSKNAATSGTVPVLPIYSEIGDVISIEDNTGVLIGANIGGVHAGKGIRQRFTGWNTAENGSGTTYQPGETFTLTGNITLFAQFTTGTDVLRKVGQAGGWVFYDAGSTQSWGRYLEAWNSDEVWLQWKTTRTITAGTSTNIGTGYANTYNCMTGTEHPAAEIVRNATYGEKTDWFLPSKDELNQIYVNLKQLGAGGLADKYYWSSSDYDQDFAYDQDFVTGIQYNWHGKDFSHRWVRAVRAF